MSTNHVVDYAPRTMGELRAEHRELMSRFASLDSTAPSKQFLEDLQQFRAHAVQLGALLDQQADRRAAQNLLDYWTTVLFRENPDAPPALLEPFDPARSPELPESACPYVGLGAFQERDSARFFGRRQLVDEFLNILNDHGLLAVVGPSGSGKSSVVRAGLLPRLKTGGPTRSQGWTYYQPFVPGSDPLSALARAVRPDNSEADIEPWVANQVEAMMKDPTHLAGILRERPGTAVLLIDQFEELYTFDRSEQEPTRAARRAFLDNLLCVVRDADRQHRVILTLRDDCVEYVAGYEVWNELFRRGRVDVPPLSISQLREAIEAPALQIGLRFEDGVIDSLLDGVVGQPAALPLLQFALYRLWKRRERNRITAAAFHDLTQAPHGQAGVLWALANAAESFYNGLPPEYQTTVRHILVHLVQPGEEWEPRSRRVWRSELFSLGEAEDRVRLVLEKLEDEQLIRVTEATRTSDDVEVELAHEALARNWPGLAEWLSDDWAERVARRRLALRTSDWLQARRTSDLLLRGSLLEEAELHRNLSADEREYVAASRAAEERRQTVQLRQIKKLHWVTGGLFAALAVVAVLAILAFHLKQLADANSVTVEEKSHTALSRALAAQSRLSSETQPNLGLLLGLQGLHTATTSEARGAVLSTLDHNPRLLRYFVAPPSDGSFPRYMTGLSYGTDSALVGGDNYGAIELWDAATQAPLTTPIFDVTASGGIGGLAYAAPRGLVAAGDILDGTIQLWDLANNASLGTLRVDDENTGAAILAGFTADWKRLAGASNRIGGSIKVWDVADARNPVVLRNINVAADTSVTKLAISPDGKMLAAATNDTDRTIALYDVDTGETKAQLPGGTQSVLALAFSPDGHRLAAGGADTGPGGDAGVVRIWNLDQPDASPTPLAGHQHAVHSLAFSPDGSRLVTGSCSVEPSVRNCSKGEVRVWDIAQVGTPIAPLVAHTDWVESVAFAPDGNSVVSAGADGTTIAWDMRPTPGPISRLPAGPAGVVSLAASRDGSLLATGASDQSITLWNLITGEPQTTIRGLSAPAASMALSPSGTKLVTSSCPGQCARGQIQLWDTSTHAPIGQPLPSHGGPVRSVAFSSTGQLMVSSGSTDHTISLWDVETGHSIGGPLNAPAEVDSLAFSPDARVLVSGQADGSLVFWDIATQAQQGQPVAAHNGKPVKSLAFAPDGQTLASAGGDGQIVLWDANSHSPIGAPLRGHVGAVDTVAFNHDGSLLASGGEDDVVRFWDVSSHEALTSLATRHTSTIIGVAFVAGGDNVEYLVSAAATEKNMDEWKVPAIPSLDDLVCGIASRNLSQREWAAFVPGEPYERTCPLLPDGPA
jgi:WD40 repeat protein